MQSRGLAVVGHWWGEKIIDFLVELDVYWVCAYANRQHALSEAVSANPEELIVCSMDLRLRLHASGVPSKRQKRVGVGSASGVPAVGSADWPIRML